MTELPRNATVLDTCVLSNFAHVDEIELLLDLPRVVTVDAVHTELADGIETHPYLGNALDALGTDIPVVTPTQQAEQLETELLKTLDPGEAQALAVTETTAGTIITDDGDARATAERRGVPLTGSIGLLVRFVEAEQISAATADEYLKRWIDEAGFHSPARDFHVFLED